IPLSYAQRRLWFLDRLEGGNATYTIPLAVRLRGTLDHQALSAALAGVVGRHGGLRTPFPDRLGGPDQEDPSAGVARIALIEHAVSEAEVPSALTQAAQRGFDLAHELPLRAHLFALGADEHVLLLVLHHIAGDGWSLAPLARDLSAAYAARLRGEV